MNGFAYVSSAIFFFVTGNILDDVSLTKTQIVGVNVDNGLDAFVFVMIA
jgi:hypothetical protein